MRENGFMPPMQLSDAIAENDPYKGATIADLKLPSAITIRAEVRPRRRRRATEPEPVPDRVDGGPPCALPARPRQTTTKEAIAIMNEKGACAASRGRAGMAGGQGP